MKQSLRNQLLEYLNEKRRFVHSGELERFGMNQNYKASNAGRRMRELAREGVVEVIYEKNKTTGIREAYYRYDKVREEGIKPTDPRDIGEERQSLFDMRQSQLPGFTHIPKGIL